MCCIDAQNSGDLQADTRPTAEEYEALVETLRREIVGKDKQIQVYKDKLLDVYMGLDSNAKSESSVSPRILKATEEQNQLLRELVQRRDAEVDRLEAKLAQNEGPSEGLMGKLNSIHEDVKDAMREMKMPDAHKVKMSEKLFHAAYTGRVDVMEEVLSQGAPINALRSNSESPLLVAVWEGHLPVVKVLVERGADIEQRNHCDDTPLYLAAYQGHTDIAQFLIDSGAKVNTIGYGSGKTSLGIAVEKNHLEVARVLRKAGGEE